MTTRSWIRKLFASRTPRTIRKAPARRHLRLELLEDRVVLSGGPNPIGQILPLHPPGASPYGVSQPDLPTAEVTGLYNLILGRTPDEAGLKAWTSVLQGGASPGDVAQRLPGFAGISSLPRGELLSELPESISRAARNQPLDRCAGQ